jgi:hypothetical protein
MITMIMGLGLGKRAAQLIAYVAVPALILLGLYLALDAYGDSRFRAGRAVEAQLYKKASDKLIEQAANARTGANSASTARVLTHVAQVEEEKEKIDDAIANGTSPLDVLFGTADGGVR